MRLFRTVIAIGACLMLVSPPAVQAQTAILQPGGDDRIQRLKANCQTIQLTISRLHTNDALLRNNIGHYYDNISRRLMARLNSRLALNQINSVKFVEISQRFEQLRTSFNTNYNDYDSSLSNLIKISCQDSPTDYYAGLIVARDTRHKVSTSARELDGLIGEYRVAVEQLMQEMRSDVVSEGQNGAN